MLNEIYWIRMRKNWCEQIRNPKASAKSTPSPPKDTESSKWYGKEVMARLLHIYCTSILLNHVYSKTTAETLERALILMKAFMKLCLAPLLKQSLLTWDIVHLSHVSKGKRHTTELLLSGGTGRDGKMDFGQIHLATWKRSSVIQYLYLVSSIIKTNCIILSNLQRDTSLTLHDAPSQIKGNYLRASKTPFHYQRWQQSRFTDNNSCTI